MMESLLAFDMPLIREVWIPTRGWYKDSAYRLPTLSRVTIDRMLVERVELYRHVPSLGQPTPMGATPLTFEESFPEDKDTTLVLRRLHLNCSGVPPVMQVERLHQWLQEATREKEPETTHCIKVVSIVQAAL